MRMTHDKLIDVVDFIFDTDYGQNYTRMQLVCIKESLQLLLLVTTIITEENMGF